MPAAEPREHLTIASCMCREVLALDPDTPLPTVLEVLKGAVHSHAVICEERRPVGIIDDQTGVALLREALSGAPLARYSALDAMASVPLTLREGAPLADALARLRERGISRAPVVDDAGQLVGTVGRSDVLAAHARELAGRCEALERSVTERTRELADAQAKLEALSLEDSLLGIGNRRAMEHKLDDLHQTALRYGNRYSVVLALFDDFDQYAQLNGQRGSDAVLRRLSGAMARSLRGTDRLFRYGRERFLVLLTETDVAGGLVSARRLCQVVRQLGIAHRRSPLARVTLSCGVSAVMQEGEVAPTWREVVARAEAALDRAREQGCNQAVMWSKAGEAAPSEVPAAR